MAWSSSVFAESIGGARSLYRKALADLSGLCQDGKRVSKLREQHSKKVKQTEVCLGYWKTNVARFILTGRHL